MNNKTRIILKTTSELVKKKSLDEITVKEICTEAGVALGTFYKYFKSKNDLVPSMYEHLDEHLKSEESDILSSKKVEDRLNAFIREFVTYVVQWGYDANTLILHNNVVAEPKPSRYMEVFLRKLLQEGEPELKIKPEKAEYLILSILRGGLVLWNSQGPDFPVEEIIIFNGKIAARAITKY